MKVWLLLALSIWVTLHAAWAADDFTISLDTSNEADYSTALNNLRTNVRDPKLNYGNTGLPVLAAPTSTKQYLRVGVKGTPGTISLVVQKSNLYVVGFLTKIETKLRVFYFSNEITSAALDKLFPEAKGAANQQMISEYGENYQSLEKVSGTTRKKAGLGLSKLNTYLKDIYGLKRDAKKEAKFLLVAIQMVSEATRFKYIEQMVLDNFPNGFNPDDKVIILQRNWDRVSTAIKLSTNGVFPSSIVLSADSSDVTTTWTVTKASDLNMGILLYIK